MTEHIPSEEFLPAGDAFVQKDVSRPAPKGYAADAWGSFRKNRSSVVAAGIILALLLFAILIAQVLCLIISRDNCAIHDLIAGTVVVDISSQMIFRTTEDLIAYKKKIAAEQAARQVY